MKDRKLVFYIVPRTNSYADKQVIKLLNNTDNYTEIVVTDNYESVYNHKKYLIFSVCDYFTDDNDYLSEFFWDLNDKNEKMFYLAYDGSMQSEVASTICIKQLLEKEKRGIIIYCSKKNIKWIAIIEDEILRFFVRNNNMDEFRQILLKYALEGSYKKWELGE